MVRLAAVDAAIFQALFSLKVLVDWSAAWVMVPLIIATVGAFIEGTMAVIGRSRHPLKRVQIDDLRQSLASLVVKVSDETGIPLASLGAGVWLVRDYRPWLWKPRLERVVRWRLDSYPAPSDVDWTKGKGTVGRCWQSGREEHQPWRHLGRRYGRELTDAQWTKLEEAGKTFGFERSEFESMLGKYSEVCAYPIKDRIGRDVVGVLSLDVPIDAVTDDVDRLARKKVRLELNAASALIYRVVHPD